MSGREPEPNPGLLGLRYRPLWLGLGVVAAELVAALVLTSLVRKHIGFRLWRVIHWLSYVAWPAALLHGLGTGSDARMAWFLWSQGICVLTAWLALVVWRLAFGWPRRRWLRLGGAVLQAAHPAPAPSPSPGR